MRQCVWFVFIDSSTRLLHSCILQCACCIIRCANAWFVFIDSSTRLLHSCILQCACCIIRCANARFVFHRCSNPRVTLLDAKTEYFISMRKLNKDKGSQILVSKLWTQSEFSIPRPLVKFSEKKVYKFIFFMK